MLHCSSTFCVAVARGEGVVSRSLASEFRLQYEISRYSVMTGCWTALRCTAAVFATRRCLCTHCCVPTATFVVHYRDFIVLSCVQTGESTVALKHCYFRRPIGVFTFAKMTAAAVVKLIFGSFLLNSVAALLPLPISDFYPSDESIKRNYRFWPIFISLFFYNQYR